MGKHDIISEIKYGTNIDNIDESCVEIEHCDQFMRVCVQSLNGWNQYTLQCRNIQINLLTGWKSFLIFFGTIMCSMGLFTSLRPAAEFRCCRDQRSIYSALSDTVPFRISVRDRPWRKRTSCRTENFLLIISFLKLSEQTVNTWVHCMKSSSSLNHLDTYESSLV